MPKKCIEHGVEKIVQSRMTGQCIHGSTGLFKKKNGVNCLGQKKYQCHPSDEGHDGYDMSDPVFYTCMRAMYMYIYICIHIIYVYNIYVYIYIILFNIHHQRIVHIVPHVVTCTAVLLMVRFPSATNL